MDSNRPTSQLKSGLWLCSLSLLAVPVSLLAISGGPCTGPLTAVGAAILLSTGIGAVTRAIYGILRVLREIHAAAILMRVWAMFSVCRGGLAGFAGGFYLLLGIISLEAFLRY
jgi:hypothetical protein